jgi:hypothetical protein
MVRAALKFALLVLAVLYSVTFFAVWIGKQYSLVGVVNVMTGVAIVGAIASFPLMGPFGVGRGQLRRIEDPRVAEEGPSHLRGELRGALLLGVSVLWLVAAILLDKALGQ